MARREFLMLAQLYNADKHKISGYYASEKLDGVRCFWDGGVSRGKPITEVPWAGVINPKTGQMKTNLNKVATGLWSRYGNPIYAPEWFLNNLPSCPLDGELYAGRKKFQETCSIIKKIKPDDQQWKKIQFAVFSSPAIPAIFQDGQIKNPNQITDINKQKILKWFADQDTIADWVHLTAIGGVPFSAELANLSEWIDTTSDVIFMVLQTKLPADEAEAKAAVTLMLRDIICSGGEGLILRDPSSVWTPKRMPTLLKVKTSLDAEAIIVGFTSGRKTDKGSKLIGRIGAMIVDFNGKRLELAGLTDEERVFSNMQETEFAMNNPGIDMPKNFQGKHFKPGDKITFLYRELTNDGIPKEARYLRKRND
jgi:DNA ligase-1